MSEDALSTYKPKSGLYLKFSAGDEVKLRVLTLDPLVSESTWENRKGETIISTKYSFIVYNWTDDVPQILSVGPGLLNRFVRLHQEEDLPALNKMDIKVIATGEELGRRYEVITLPESKEITRDILSRIKDINLEEAIKDSKGRLSELEGDGEEIDEDIDIQDDIESPGYAKAKQEAAKIKNKQNVDEVFETDDEEVDLGEL